MSTTTQSKPSLFTTTLETIEESVTDIRNLFGTNPGAAGVRKYGRAAWEGMVLEAEQFVDAVVSGRKPTYLFVEAMSSSQFPLLFADSLDRQLYGAYMAAPTTWSKYIRRGTVNDFRKVKRFATTGIRNVLTPVAEGAPHQERSTDELQYEYAVSRFGAGFGVTFEQMINDDLGAFKRLPQDLSQSAVDTEEFLATRLYCGPSGPLAAFFNGGNDNVAASNAPLTRQAIQDALTRLMKRKDERGNPIVVKAVKLVVGPGLALAAQQILEAKEYRAKDASGNETIISGNGIASDLELIVNYWIPIVATTANADTSWFLFADANSTPRPAAELGFLRGYEAPALYERMPNTRRIGGGAEVPWDFDEGVERKKIEHILGGTTVDARMCIGSNGSGVA